MGSIENAAADGKRLCAIDALGSEKDRSDNPGGCLSDGYDGVISRLA